MGLGRLGVVIAAIGLLSGAALAAPAPSPAAGASAYPADYVAARTAARALMRKTQPNFTDSETHKGLRIFDVEYCTERDEEVGPEPTWRAMAVEDLALKVSEIEAGLTNGGYSETVFGPPLQQYERRELARIAARAVHPPKRNSSGDDPAEEAYEQAQDASLAALARGVEAGRLSRQPWLKPVVSQGGCGAAEAPVVLRSDPARAVVWFITQFSFEVCKAKGLDPWNLDACGRWGEMALGRKTYLSGTYVYQAQWAGGARTRGQTSVQPGDDDTGPPVVVWIRQR
jgi:hypothetical protein